jgi:hypothetical protein
MASRTMVSAFVRRGGQAHATVGDGNEGRWPVGEGIEELESRNVAAPLPLPAAQPTPSPAVAAPPHAEPPSLLASVGGERERPVELWRRKERKKEWGKKKERKKKRKEKRKNK